MSQTANLTEHRTPAQQARPSGDGGAPPLPQTGPDGLTAAEVEHRRATYGYNELVEKHVPVWKRFLGYFWGPIPWMIEVAAALSAVVRHWDDFGIILALLVLNAVVGFWEEYHADTAIEALKKKLALIARVKRGGRWDTIPARELVPGDLVRLRLGDVIPADALLREEGPLQIDQSALTGESLPVDRSVDETVYSGSIVKKGEAVAVVSAIGTKTYFGKTASLVQEARTESHFQQAVLKIGDYLIVLAAALVVVILVTALFRHESMLHILRFALVLTVASIPVAMPTVLSVTMAVGARLLSVKEAVVRRLAAIEELAGVDVLCSDKTGTLTKNDLQLSEPYLAGGASKALILATAALASREEDRDPIDLAVLKGVTDRSGVDGYTLEHFMPFDPEAKRTEATVRSPDGKTVRATKGAPQVILRLASIDDEGHRQAEAAINDFAHRGYRSLGVARAEGDGPWRFLGVLPLSDPPRDDSKSTVQMAGRMGIRVKMVTGDQTAIAREISTQLGLGTNIVSAQAFAATKHHESGQMADAIERADGFAEVFPEHKYHIVEVLQQRGHIVGMTGDGVNDAPALKKADAGIAVSGSTDAARSAADIVLLTPGLSVIVDAIHESRKIFQRMNSYATYRIAETIRVLLFMTLSILVFNFYPVTAIMIVLLALLNDGAILSIAYDRAKGSSRPEAWNMRTVLGLATILGVVGVMASFGLFYLGEHVLHLSRQTIQTLMYLKLSVAGHLTIFVTRTRRRFWEDRPANVLIAAVVGTQLVATIIATFGLFMPPLGWKLAALVWGYALVWFLLADQVKLAAYRIFDLGQPGLLTKKPHTA
jgi:H+-transporting ATPase